MESVVPETCSVQDCIRVLDESEGKIAIVVDKENKLVGTVTDGDVRRGILRGIEFSAPVSEVMNRNPRVAHQNDNVERILHIMRSERLRQVPVVDDDRRVVGVELLPILLDTPMYDNLVVIMAGGKGTRLHPLTGETPKPLLPVGKRPILETIILQFRQAGFKNFLLSVNHMADQIEAHFGSGEEYGINVQYLREDSPLGTAGSLTLMKERPVQPFFVMNADILTNVDLINILNFHVEHKSAATMCVREYSFQVPYGVVRFDDQLKLTEIQEKPMQKYFANAGIYVLEPSALDHIEPGTECNMPDLLDRITEKGENCSVCPIREYWLDIGQMHDYERANQEFPTVFQ